MGLWAMTYSRRPEGSKALLCCVRLPRQRWHHLICFGRLGHYYEDGGCEHTDAYLAALTPYGEQVVKLEPFGGKDRRPKRFAKRPNTKPEQVLGRAA